MDEQRAIIELLTQIRDEQRAHFEHYRQFTHQVQEATRREQEQAQRYRDEMRKVWGVPRDLFIMAFLAIVLLVLLFFGPVFSELVLGRKL